MHVYGDNLLSDYVPTGKNIILWIFWSHIWEDAEMIWNVKLIRNITSVLLLNYIITKAIFIWKIKNSALEKNSDESFFGLNV